MVKNRKNDQNIPTSTNVKIGPKNWFSLKNEKKAKILKNRKNAKIFSN